MFDIDKKLSSALEGLNNKELKQVFRYAEFIVEYPRLANARQWLLDTFTDHPRLYMAALNILMFLAPATKLLRI